MFKGINMSKYLKHTISINELKRLIDNNIQLEYTYVMDDYERQAVFRKIASDMISNFDSNDIFSNINNNDLQTIMSKKSFISKHEHEEGIYKLLCINSIISDDILNQLYNKDNNKVVYNADILDLVIRFLKHTTEDDIL